MEKVYQYIKDAIRAFCLDKKQRFSAAFIHSFLDLKCSVRTIQRYLARMAELGLIVRHGRRGGFSLA